ncbi:hypothetical protein F511_19933 [Dorcoceras hygrometricum]|uniref:Uncharacterized protein n=1 Tax=Dorcoceras hygrometricum TaxID=472368 RepID=A0A2Z7D987_9LAMI|nr:hypothetical protein F511_19933 [Dorcoceras hygrometricum]
MTSSQSADEERPAVAQAHMIQQMSREAQEMKRRRRRRFQSQVTVEEADVSYYSRSCRQLPFISTVDEYLSPLYMLTSSLMLPALVSAPAGSSSLRNNHICWSELASARLRTTDSTLDVSIANPTTVSMINQTNC